MAPEQVRGEPAGPGCDVFALGAILYETITGCRPFPGASVQEVFQRILAGPPERPSVLVSDLHPDLEALCLRALSSDPAKRPATASELRAQLVTILARISGTRTFQSGRVAPGGAPLLVIVPVALAFVATLVGWALYEHATGVEQSTQRLETELTLERERERAKEESALLRNQATQLEERLLHADALQAAAAKRERELSERLGKVEEQLRSLRTSLATPTGHAAAILDTMANTLATVPGAEVERAKLLLRRGRYPEALKAAQSAPESVERTIVLFTALMGSGKQDAARKVLTAGRGQAVAGSADELYIRFVFGELRGQQALNALQEGVRRHPNSARLWALLSDTCNGLGMRHGDANTLRLGVEAGDRSIALDPTNAQVLYSRSACRYHLWLYSGKSPDLVPGVLADLRAARELNPRAEYFTDCGKSYIMMLEEPAAALPELEQAILHADRQRLLREQCRARAWLGVAHLQLDQEARAVKVWLDAIRIGPTHPATYKFIAYLPQASEASRRQVMDAMPAQIRAQVEDALAKGIRTR